MTLMLSPLAAAEGSELRRLHPDELPQDYYATATLPPTEVWLSRAFLVQIFDENGVERLTVNRTTIDTSTGLWIGGMNWDDLMEVKRQCGRADRWAVELYPPDSDIVDTNCLRHLWMLTEPPRFGWHS